MAESLASRMEPDTRCILLFSNAVNADVESLIKACQPLIPVPIVGGLAASFDPNDPSPLVISTEKIFFEDAVVAAFVSGESLSVKTVTLNAWETIGKEFTVTRVEGKKLYELDGMKIEEVYSRYFGKLDREKLLYLSLAHPLVRETEDGKMTRVLLEYEGEYGIYTGSFEEGEKVQIGFGNYGRMIECMQRGREIVRETPIEAFWGFVCISFTRGYFDLLKRSMVPYLKNAPRIHLAITFGEFGQIKENRNAFLNNTIIKVYLSEDPEARFHMDPVEVELDDKDHLLETFSTLVTSSSKEIIALNRYLEEQVKKRTKELAALNASLERRVKQEVQKNREKDKMLYHQSKLAAMGEMINNIAHQWRQPLNIIALVMQDLALKAKMGTLKPEAVVKAERKINETLNYLSDTIDDFRSFASMGEESAQSGRFEVAKTIREVVRLVSVMLEDVGIHLELDLPESDCVAAGRANDLKQVVLNLVYNAVDVLKERRVEAPRIRIGMRRKGKEVVVYVADNGGGIEKEIIDKIFEPYFTTKYQARGTGLGLYMSRMIVQKRLGGSIEAFNDPEGARFETVLPVLDCGDET
jgi:signal transduction histidine kinase